MIVPMKRLMLIAMKRDEEALMRTLQDITAVQVTQYGEQAGDSEALSAAQARSARLSAAINTLKPYTKKPGMGPLPEYTAAELMAELDSSGAVCDTVEALARQLAVVRSDRDKRRALIKQLEPWREMDTPIEEVRSTKTVKYFTGIADASALLTFDNVDAAVQTFGSGAGREVALLIACMAYDTENVRAALKTIDFSEFSFPALTGTVQQNIDRLEGEISALLEKETALIESLTVQAKSAPLLKRSLDASNIICDREAAKTAAGATETAFVLTGWATETSVEDVKAAVFAVTPDCYLEFTDPAEDDTPPTALKNNAIVTPFESVENMYSTPAYNGIDATGMMTPFYLLFFGMMMSDSGYGLVMLIGGLLFVKLLKPQGGTKQLAQVIAMCGASTVICGMFIGTFFGLNWPEIFGPNSPLPLLFDPLDNIMTMIIICCGMGIFQMMFGIGVKMYMCFRDGDPKAAIFDNFSWMLLVLGLVGLLASGMLNMPALKPVGIVMAILGAAILLIFSGRDKKKLFSKITGGLGKLYNVTGYLGDTLSYVRILALGLVSGAMGMVFNKIGLMIFDALKGGGIIAAIIGAILCAVVIVLLHAFSLFINTLGTYVHCARLQYVEFFGKFYEANGIPFRPLGYKTKNVVVKRQG